MHHMVATGVAEYLLADLLLLAQPGSEDVLDALVLERCDGLLADHASIGHDADPVDGEATTQAADQRHHRRDIRRVAGPQLAADRAAVLVEDQPDDHLLEIRAMVLAVASLADGLAAGALEVQARRIEQHHRKTREKVATLRKELFLDQILRATRTEWQAVLLIRLRKRLAQPGHRPVEMLQVGHFIIATHIIPAPFLGSSVGARIHEPVDHRKTHDTLQIEAKPAVSHEIAQAARNPALLPQPTK